MEASLDYVKKLESEKQEAISQGDLEKENSISYELRFLKPPPINM